jgi:hypothetical protein
VHINTTNKTKTNDYFTNTENVAMVHVCRVFDATDVTDISSGPINIVVENLGKIIDILPQLTTSATLHQVIDDPITFSGNVITIPTNSGTVVNGNILNILVVGKR